MCTCMYVGEIVMFASTLDEDINGEAFMELKDKDLSKMGFTKGQRMKMLKMITTVKVSLIQ